MRIHTDFKMRKNLVILAAILLTACASPPRTYSFSNTKTYEKTYDEVWEDLIGFFASRNIQIKNIAKDSGVVYAETTQFNESMADCGDPGLFQVMSKRVNFNVFVTRSGPNPKVTVNATYSETRRFDRNVVTVSCNSKGTLERIILTQVGR
ncbi:hypothetical protein ACFJIS_17775 [Variovorax boronicumulans]|uniref:hypothetical protein n=1 Tax=Variovorax boronicumulans TaxID=436515 RepID=UPI0036F1E56B